MPCQFRGVRKQSFNVQVFDAERASAALQRTVPLKA
jgi:hypothetical protein